MCQREGVVDFAELLLRSYELLTQNDGLREHYRRRFSHLLVDEFQDTNLLQYKWLRALTGPRHGGVRRRRRRPVDLRVPRRERREHAALRARLRDADRPVRLIKLEQNYRSHGDDPRRGERAHPAQPVAARQEPVDRRGPRRAGARLLGAVRPRRGGLRRRHRQGPRRRGRVAVGDRAALPEQRAVARARACAVRARAFRIASTAACASSSAPEVKHALAYLRLDRRAGRRRRVPARDQLSAARHRRALARAAAGRARAARARRCGRRRAAACVGGKAGAAIAQFVQADRAAACARRRRCRCPRRSST